MTTSPTQKRIDSTYWTVKAQPRLSITSLVRSKDWRDTLDKDGLVEVLDRGDTCAWLVSPEFMDELMDGYSKTQDRLEEESLRTLIETRADNRQPLTGAALADAAKRYLTENIDVMRSVVDGD